MDGVPADDRAAEDATAVDSAFVVPETPPPTVAPLVVEPPPAPDRAHALRALERLRGALEDTRDSLDVVLRAVGPVTPDAGTSPRPPAAG